MRIAYVCADPGIPVFGAKGSTLHVQEIIRALRGLGAQVELFATRFDGEPPLDLRDLRVHTLPPAPKGDVAAREQKCLTANADLHAALEREGPFDLVYERYSLWSHAGMEYARDTGVPGVLEVNAPLIEEQAAHRELVDRAGAERVAERVFGAARVLVAVSREMAAHLARFAVTAGKVHVVTNGVNPRRFAADVMPACPAPAGMFTVGFLGHLKPWHGFPILVDAFAILHERDPNTRLLVVGEGPKREKLEAVRFAGRVAFDEVPGWLASMDVGVAPYPSMEHFYFSPLKVFEYMAAGLPVVASRLGQLAELIEDGVTGILCPPGDAAALAEALDRLRRDPELRRRLGRAARQSVLREHTWDAVARRVLRLAGLEACASVPCVEVSS